MAYRILGRGPIGRLRSMSYRICLLVQWELPYDDMDDLAFVVVVVVAAVAVVVEFAFHSAK